MKQSVPFSSSRLVDEILVEQDAYIAALTKKYGPFVDSEAIAQLLRMKLAAALVTRDVHNIHAYLKSMAHNEYVSSFRCRKLAFPLIMTNDGEIQQGYWLNGMKVSEGLGDPQLEVDEAIAFNKRLGQLVRAIISLPYTQRWAAICVLRERVDDIVLFTAAFKHYGVDISMYQWPTDPKDKQCLQASYAPVRHKLAQIMNIDLKAFKRRSCKSYKCS